MRLEFHQLDRRGEHLRVRHPGRQRRLLASLAASGQQTPIVVVAVEGQTDRYLVIDGYQRMAALQQLGRDTVEALLWPMSEAEALLLDGSLRWAEHQSALEQGWLLAEMEQRFGYGLEELARRFDRSVSWVSPADGCGLRAAPLRHAGSRATLCRLAGRFAVGPRAPARLPGAIFQNAAAGATGGDDAVGCARARSGNRRGHSATCPAAADGSVAGDGSNATAPYRVPDRACTPGTRADVGADRKGAASRAC